MTLESFGTFLIVGFCVVAASTTICSILVIMHVIGGVP